MTPEVKGHSLIDDVAPVHFPLGDFTPVIGTPVQRKIADRTLGLTIPKRPRSQGSFAARSVCDRIAFALGESPKPDCTRALQRKASENLPAGFDGTLSPVQFEGETCGIAAIFSDS